MIDDTSRRAPMVAATGEQFFMSNFTSSETLRILNLMIKDEGGVFSNGLRCDDDDETGRIDLYGSTSTHIGFYVNDCVHLYSLLRIMMRSPHFVH